MAEEFKDFVKQLELIGKIPILKGYNYEDRKVLANLAYFKSFQVGEDVIVQGDVNLTLFFLIKGRGDIFVDKAFIKSFLGSGYLFGEMSLVNHTSATATVKANTEIVMLCINIKDIFGLEEATHYRLHREIYRSVAEILAQKLIATNKLASTWVNQQKEAEIS